MYAQGYVQHFLVAGEVTICDRSWYNRAGVEGVIGFCTKEAYVRFLQYLPIFERAVVVSGIILIKYWLDISMEEQERPFKDRIANPHKIWKLSPMNVESYRRYYTYSQAKDDMLIATDKDYTPCKSFQQTIEHALVLIASFIFSV
ncbi:hypothetical protein IQ238_25565 [Pleurocapsales cyanobacterium LEGE 06147]|nr:hypothetical protein [Pleurocapsales cyanobacterium LEGE 06147]